MIEISADELRFVFSRSSGPGGQNVNKLSTRVTVCFDVAASPSLSDIQKELVLKKLASRVDKTGLLKITCQKYRTQAANRSGAVARLTELLNKALKPKPIRKKTVATYTSKEARLKKKKHRGQLKAERAKKHLRNTSDIY
jgi:ribosome-associated protein